jgi:hypothetical protein
LQTGEAMLQHLPKRLHRQQVTCMFSGLVASGRLTILKAEKLYLCSSSFLLRPCFRIYRQELEVTSPTHHVESRDKMDALHCLQAGESTQLFIT